MSSTSCAEVRLAGASARHNRRAQRVCSRITFPAEKEKGGPCARPRCKRAFKEGRSDKTRPPHVLETRTRTWRRDEFAAATGNRSLSQGCRPGRSLDSTSQTPGTHSNSCNPSLSADFRG